jgi:hypothetical protein
MGSCRHFGASVSAKVNLLPGTSRAVKRFFVHTFTHSPPEAGKPGYWQRAANCTLGLWWR